MGVLRRGKEQKERILGGKTEKTQNFTQKKFKKFVVKNRSNA